tara:strand:+ start:172 stop:555 length:384 start_codon:yes stop_codon:yes gene_type:complete
MKNSKIIKTNLAPQAIGAYSQGVLYDNLIFTSGQIPIGLNSSNLISSKFSEQLKQVLKNLKNLIESEGSNIDKIIKLNVYLTDLNNFNTLNEVFIDFFNERYPARSVVEVSRLPKDAMVEIDAVCYK